tara:strand:- start:369 stop:590 length:222 start_codon:yes stop_codon:yes gene_type:complete
MKDDQTDFMVDRFSIVNEICDEGIIAVREQVSVAIDETRKEIKMHDLTYTFDEIIAISRKIEKLLEKDLVDVT